MIEENAAASKNIVGFAIVNRHPVGIEFGYTIRATWPERRLFYLRNRLNFAKHFRSGGLIKTYLRIHQANRLKKIQCSNARNLSCRMRLVKGNANETLCSQIVDFCGTGGMKQTNASAQIGQIKLHQVQVGMPRDTQLLNTPEVNRTRSAIGAVDFVAFAQE